MRTVEGCGFERERRFPRDGLRTAPANSDGQGEIVDRNPLAATAVRLGLVGLGTYRCIPTGCFRFEAGATSSAGKNRFGEN
ncbi:hypothetical protein BRC77_05280 [Halobacteriales archaeon QH_8_64_26]|nr:MAG: hypothetical protein BRC77_05280 [Halobacteriales archaeon QH_8_64_26]